MEVCGVLWWFVVFSATQFLVPMKMGKMPYFSFNLEKSSAIFCIIGNVFVKWVLY